MTYEQKAKEIVHELGAILSPSYSISHSARMQRLNEAITTALREAGNAKLEEAARLVEDGPLDPEQFVSGRAVAANFDDVAERIRSLIEKD